MYFGFLLILITTLSTHAQDECGCTEVVSCPPNSNTTGYGAASIADCVCNPGFMRVGSGCFEMFDCPPNSTAEFTLTAGSCTCLDGFVPLVPEGRCVELYRCPLNSRPTGSVALSILDCVCDPGFTRLTVGGGCLRIYDCPLNSTKPWALSMSECVCMDGYTSANNSCVPSISTPESPGGLSITLIASVAVGGVAVLSGAGWAVVRFMFFTPTAAPPASAAPTPAGALDPKKSLAASYNPAAVRLNGRFIEYEV